MSILSVDETSKAPSIWVYDVDLDSFTQLSDDAGASTSSSFTPTGHYWDPSDSRLLAVETSNAKDSGAGNSTEKAGAGGS